MRSRAWVFSFTISSLLTLPGASDASDPRESVVKIYAEHRYRDYRFPWHAGIPYSSTGSGVVIEGNRILTNAHVVSDQTFLQVRLHGRSEKHVARLVAVSHDSDLAVLSVDDPGFFEGVPTLPLGDLPEAQQRVVVCGFPMGGDTLSATAGIVSRIEQQAYAHSGVELLAVQIDAAVNPGSSDCYYEEALIDPDRMVIHFLDSEDECDIERFLTE